MFHKEMWAKNFYRQQPAGKEKIKIKTEINKITYHCEVHDLQDPDGECKVDNHGDKEEENEEVQTAFTPTIDSHWVRSRATRPLKGTRLGCQNILLLGHLKRDERKRDYIIISTVLIWLENIQ